MLLLAVAAALAQPSGPAILLIQRGNDTDYVHFSSFERCEAARRMLQAEWAERVRADEAKGFKLIPGTGPRWRCIPG